MREQGLKSPKYFFQTDILLTKQLKVPSLSSCKQSFERGNTQKGLYELIWLRFFRFSTDFFEIFNKCWIYVFLKPHKISAYLDNFQGRTKGKKLKNQKKAKKVQPNELISLFVHFPFQSLLILDLAYGILFHAVLVFDI